MVGRRLRSGFAFAWFALLVQLLAPIGAGAAMARAVVEQAPICHADPGGDAQRRGGGQRHDGLCPICQVCCHAPQLLGAAAAAVLPVPAPASFVVPAERAPLQPRAPPRDRPYARAPPFPPAIA